MVCCVCRKAVDRREEVEKAFMRAMSSKHGSHETQLRSSQASER